MADRCSICGIYLESLADIFASENWRGTTATKLTQGIATGFLLRLDHQNHAHLATYEHVEGTLTDEDD